MRDKKNGSGEAAEAGDKQLSSCAAEKMKYSATCLHSKANYRGDVPLAS
jgi:hypothetical protein